MLFDLAGEDPLRAIEMGRLPMVDVYRYYYLLLVSRLNNLLSKI